MSPSPSPSTEKQNPSNIMNSEGSDRGQFCLHRCTDEELTEDGEPQCQMWCVRRMMKQRSWNPFEGIHIYRIEGAENCRQHIREINEDKIPDWNRAELHINVIEKSKDIKIDGNDALLMMRCWHYLD
ncbi:hypothetical protein K7432_009012 [Basidiobolus ranarum]|uniref:Uncharacterized protein n=1 Tax=Basidiobolus ranarum TaxID=34480 RepID=A0ABR2VY35_9FUNG